MGLFCIDRLLASARSDLVETAINNLEDHNIPVGLVLGPLLRSLRAVPLQLAGR